MTTKKDHKKATQTKIFPGEVVVKVVRTAMEEQDPTQASGMGDTKVVIASQAKTTPDSLTGARELTVFLTAASKTKSKTEEAVNNTLFQAE